MENREQYIEKAKARLDQWDADIQKVEAKVHEAEADAKIEYQKQLDEMRSRRNQAETQLEALKTSSEGAWADMQSGFEKAWTEISRAYENALSRFK